MRRRMKIAVVGLGFVGIPAAAALAGAGHDVVGIDIDPRKVEALNAGRNPIATREEDLDELVARVVVEGRLRASPDFEGCGRAEAVLICVDTPIDPHSKEPDYTALKAALEHTAAKMKKGVLVSVESTLAPGTMREVVRPALEEVSGLKAGEDFGLVHCPERVTAGRLLHNLLHLDRILGTEDEVSAQRAHELYDTICQGLHGTNWVNAELSKTVENAYRYVQLAFANEVGLLCEFVGGDAFRVRELVNTRPDRDLLLPGPGVGGHCLAKDAWLLNSSAGGLSTLIPRAREVNEGMTEHVVALIQRGLESVRKELPGAKILILGGAYRENIGETANSPALKLYEVLKDRGAEVRLHDPHIPEVKGVDLWRDLSRASEGRDCLVLVTPHDDYRGIDWEATFRGMNEKVVVDCRGFLPTEIRHDPEVTFLGLGIAGTPVA